MTRIGNMGSSPAPTTQIGSSPRFGSGERFSSLQPSVRPSPSNLPLSLSPSGLRAKMLPTKKKDTRRQAKRSPGAFTIYQERLPGRQVQISIPPYQTMFLTDELPVISLYISLCPGPQTPDGLEANRGANLKVTDDSE